MMGKTDNHTMHNEMKTSFRIIAALTLFAVCVSSAIASETTEFNVASYNLRYKNSADSADGNGWERRCPVIADLIRFHEFDIFGTQEGYKDQLEQLKSRLPGYDYIGVARDDGKEAGEHSAIFYDTAMFDLLDHGDFWLSETPDRPGLGWDAACVRICTWGKFRHKESGKVFQFFNLHLDHVGVTARVEGVRLVQRKMKEFGFDLPTFLTGDFNVDQTHDLYGVLLESGLLADSYHKTSFRYALNGTWNDYKTDGYSESRIDHIFTTDHILVDKYGILTDTYRAPVSGSDPQVYRSRIPSDHYPVKVKVRIP